jgi:hypothetical protein
MRPKPASGEVRPVTVGGQKFFAFATAGKRSAMRWTAYNEAGNVVGTGTG